MRIIVWNCRGAANKGFTASMRNLCSDFKLDLTVLLEPRISGLKAKNAIRRLGYRHFAIVEARGFVGGIWMMRQRDDVKVRIVEMNEQFIHACMGEGNEKWFFIAVYACPQEERRGALWEGLNNIGRRVNGEWLVAGDFNEIAYPCKQKRGARVNVHKCNKFRRQWEEWQLMDLEMKGPKYTWKGPKRRGYDRLYKKLDRCLCNIQWQRRFPEAIVRVGARIYSNHHPLLIDTRPNHNYARRRPFIFEAAWLAHEKFEEFMDEKWENEVDVLEALWRLQGSLKWWNKTVFRRVEQRKRELNRKIAEIQQKTEAQREEELLREEKQLQDELAETLRQEEII